MLKSLNHDNIIKVYDFKIDPSTNTSYMIMEYFWGTTVDQIEDLDQDFSCQDSTFVVSQLINAVCYLHSKRICHRDIKPQNVIVNTNLELKLIDFNIAKAIKRSDTSCYSESQMSMKSMTQIGSPLYAAPEVYSTNFYTEKIDIWGVGIILLYLTSNDANEFEGMNKDNRHEILDKLASSRGHIDSKVSNFLTSCLEIEQDNRPSIFECLEIVQNF